VKGPVIFMKHVAKKSEHDKHVVEAVVRRFGPVSRVGIYTLTNFRRNTISSIVRQLLLEGRLVEDGRSNNPLGRKQILLRSNEEYGFILGVEFDDEAVVAGVMDLRPRVKHTVKEPTNLKGREELIKQLKSCVRRAISETNLVGQSAVGIGIADPGLVDSRNGVTITSSTIEFWNQVPLQRIFEQEFHVPVVVESKTRARTIAERMLGAGQKQDNLIYLDYGTGIGAGIVVDGKVLYGKDCGVGEVGHTHIVDDGPACKCGSIGCLEAVAGAAAIEGRIRKALSEGAGSKAMELADGDSGKITVWNVLAAASAGDKMCGNLVLDIGRLLGTGIANLVNLFNPAIIVLDKRLELAGDSLLDQITRTVKGQALTSSSQQLAIRIGELGAEAGLLGVGLAVLERHFEIPALRPPTYMVEPGLVEPGFDNEPHASKIN
jgi:predicted NBD/HSP70 family sugar kinase